MTEELKDFCKAQLNRLRHLDGFPKHREAVADYVCALMEARSPERVRATVDEFVQAEPIDHKCPTAAMLRRTAYDKREIQETTTKHCQICDGIGVVTVWKLITYRGNSFVMEKSEALPDVRNNEQASAFAQMLADHYAENPKLASQTVLSAAKDCSCRKVSAA